MHIKDMRFQKVALILGVFLALQPSKPARADDEYKALKSFVTKGGKEITLWVRGWKNDPTDLRSKLVDGLKVVAEHTALKDRLPQKMGILLDGTWDKSSGYWAPDLKTPAKDVAILIAPRSIMEQKDTERLLAHEITHLIHYTKRDKEDSWLMEGAAMLMEYVVTDSMTPSLREGFKTPETSLTSTFDPKNDEYHEGADAGILAKYGHVFQYSYYLYRLCGKNDLLDKLLTSESKSVGIALIDELLKAHSGKLKDDEKKKYCESFKESFKAFQVARFNPKFTDESGYIVSRNMKGTVRDKSMDLPAHSAMVYKIKSDTEKCPDGEIAWGASRCIKIRYE